MRWHLKWGEHERRLKELHEKSGYVHPNWEPKPEIEGLEPIWAAYIQLSSCRLVEGGPIPWTAINDYARANGMDWYDRKHLEHCVREIDNVVLADFRDKAEQRRRPHAG